MTSTACLLVTLPQGADVTKVLTFLNTSNFNDFAVTSLPVNILINLAFGSVARADTDVITAGAGPTCVIARVTGDLQQLYKQLIDNGFPQFLIASRPFHELVSVIFAAPVQSTQEVDYPSSSDYFCRTPTPIFTPPQSPAKQDENESPSSSKKRKLSRGSASSDRARCQICRKNVLGSYIKPEDIIRHAFYHANICRYACTSCKQSSNNRSYIDCACGNDRKIIDLTNPTEASRDITELAKKCFPDAYALCF